VEHGLDSGCSIKRKGIDFTMRVVLHYRVNGVVRDWVCSYDRLDHVMNVCVEKGFDIVGVEELA
jgi:hypothetical protein